jgi:hypothetical protein
VRDEKLKGALDGFISRGSTRNEGRWALVKQPKPVKEKKGNNLFEE